MAKEERIETETHHNQPLTGGAEAKQRKERQGKPGKRVVAVQLDERQYAAFQFLGGVAGLKSLLCPEGLCIRCRLGSSLPGSYLDSLCAACQKQRS